MLITKKDIVWLIVFTITFFIVVISDKKFNDIKFNNRKIKRRAAKLTIVLSLLGVLSIIYLNLI